MIFFQRIRETEVGAGDHPMDQCMEAGQDVGSQLGWAVDFVLSNGSLDRPGWLESPLLPFLMNSPNIPQILLLASLASLQASASIFLGSADPFGVLAGTSITSTGTTVVNGDLGVYPGLSITGFPPGVVNGTVVAGGSVAQQALADALAAYVSLGTEIPSQNLTGSDLGGLTLGSGVRKFDAAAQLTGILTLDGGGNSAARFDFLIGSTLTTSVSSSIVLINGARADNVYWRVGTSTTLGVGSDFAGTVLADQSVTVNSGAQVLGRIFAIQGTASLDANSITVPSAIPEVESMFPIGALCLVAGLMIRRSSKSR